MDIQFLEFKNLDLIKPVRICHLGIFVTALDMFTYTVPTTVPMVAPDVMPEAGLLHSETIAFSRGYADLSDDCQVDIADAVNDGQAAGR